MACAYAESDPLQTRTAQAPSPPVIDLIASAKATSPSALRENAPRDKKLLRSTISSHALLFFRVDPKDPEAHASASDLAC